MSLTIQQMKGLLGEDAVGMTDTHVEQFLVLVEGLADQIIDTYIGEHRKRVAQHHEMKQAA